MSITMWLAFGERGISSNAIARTALGADPVLTWPTWPHDPWDLRRCLLLLDQAPETRESGLQVLGRWCPRWAALVKIWDLLSETLRSEIGDSLPPEGSAPKTYALMREALASATVE